jgi:hypothetical protein
MGVEMETISKKQSDEATKVRRLAAERGLVSYMNDTKWRELCMGFYAWEKSPRFRVHDVLASEGYVSEWDGEWFYHPRPYVSIQWLEVELIAELLPVAIAMCKKIGAAAEIAGAGLRIWGWVGPSDKPQFV